MTIIDYLIFGLYMVGVLGIGFYHFLKNKSTEDYYVGSRSIKASFASSLLNPMDFNICSEILKSVTV